MAGAGGPLGTGARSPFPALPRWRRGRPGARGDPLMGTRWLAIDTATDIASVAVGEPPGTGAGPEDRKSTRLNSSHLVISYAVFCLKKKKKQKLLSYATTRLDAHTVCVY